MKNLTFQKFDVNELGAYEMREIEGTRGLNQMEQRSVLGGAEMSSTSSGFWYDFGYFLGKAVKGIVKEMQV